MILTDKIVSVFRSLHTVRVCCVLLWWGTEQSWWRDQMETFSALLALCEGNLTKASDADLWCFLWSAWTNYRDAGDLRHHRAHHDVTGMLTNSTDFTNILWDQFAVTWTAPLVVKQLWGISVYKPCGISLLTSQITNNSSLCPRTFSGWQQRTHQRSILLTLYEGNPSVIGVVPSKRVSNAENTSMSWRDHDPLRTGTITITNKTKRLCAYFKRHTLHIWLTFSCC